MPVFSRCVRLPASRAEAFAWHERPGAFERLAPPWDPPRVVERRGGIRDGDTLTLELRRGPLRLRWRAEHRDYRPGESFTDVQAGGPFARWEHTHRFETEGPDSCRLEDRIEYALPLGALGAALGERALRRQLAAVFAYRQRVTADDLRAHAPCREGGPMHVAVTGASGLLGSALVPYLTTGGHAVTRLVRGRPGEGEVGWDPRAARLDGPLPGGGAVVHLAAESIAAGRWTAAKKEVLRQSRVQATRHLATALAAQERPPAVFVGASAIGFYGDRGDEVLDEDAPAGAGFLAELARAWEAAAEPLVARGVRVVHLRFGVVLAPAGGALAKMLPAFRLGAGGPVGSGRQWFSWVALDDALDAVHFALATPSLRGPVNVVAPEAVRQGDFARALGRVLRRPALAPLPAFAARLAFGEMADHLLLASTRVDARRLREHGFRFRHASLDDALRHALGRARA